MTGPRSDGNRITKRVADASELLVPLDHALAEPLHRQIYDGLRAGILAGRFAAGMRLPSTRVLATELGVARNTVVLAFEQLVAEGFVEAHRGGGTRVRAQLSGARTRARAPAATVPRRAGRDTPPISARWTRVLAGAHDRVSPRDAEPIPFMLGLPAIDLFPSQLWARLTSRRWRTGRVFLGHASSGGDAALRNAIASYVTNARGARCTAEQVLVVSGAQQALDLAARVLVDPGDAAWMEDPGYPGARSALTAAGARVIPVPVDDEGMDVAAGERAAPSARLAYVTPSHQFPLGIVMSAARRLALLAWARRTRAWILEDDYDSEFRYAGRPIPCLQGLDAERDDAPRVLYVGTFSKTLAPSLRLGYLIVPDALIESFHYARMISGGHSSTVDQGVLADFIGDGHYGRHVRRVRTACAERQRALLDSAESECGGSVEVEPDVAGLHMVAWLPKRASDLSAVDAASKVGVHATALSRYSAAPIARGALLLGYAAFDEGAIRSSMRKLGRTLQQLRR